MDDDGLIRWAMVDYGGELTLPALPPWARDAACRDVDQELFFPRRGQPTRPAKQICQDCPVVDSCLAYALELEGNEAAHARAGVFGGHSGRERARLAKQTAA